MICKSCGADNAEDARYCTRCGAEQPRAAARPRRGRAIAVVASCVIVALAGYGGWRFVTSSWHGAEPPRSHSEAVSVPTGSAPPPTDQSAAPLPPPSALPAGAEAAADAARPAEGAATSETTGSGAASAEATDMVPPAVGASTAAAGGGAKAPSSTTEAAHGATRAHMPRPRATPPARATGPPASAPPQVEAPAKRLAAAAVPAPRPDDHWTQMNNDLSRCTREDFINRVICDQRVRIRYCDGYWGKVAQCPVSPSTADVR